MADLPTASLKLTDEQWGIILRELPRRADLQPFRDKIRDLCDDAQTWGEAGDEFNSLELSILDGLGFPWLDELVAAKMQSLR